MNIDNLESDFTLFHYWEMSAMCCMDGLQENLSLTQGLDEIKHGRWLYIEDFALQEKNTSFRIQKDIGTFELKSL